MSADSGFTVAVVPTALPVTWWMVDENADLQVEGSPGAQIQVDLTLASPPCGPVTVSVGGTTVTVDGSQEHTVTVDLDEAGEGIDPDHRRVRVVHDRGGAGPGVARRARPEVGAHRVRRSVLTRPSARPSRNRGRPLPSVLLERRAQPVNRHRVMVASPEPLG